MAMNLCLGVLILASLYHDLKFSRIPNVITVSGMAAGIGLHSVFNDWQGILFSVAGCLAGLLVVAMLYFIGAVGAGDVKLFGAIGALCGAQYTLIVLMYSILYAGLIGVAVLVYRKEVRQRVGSVFRSLCFFICFKDMEALAPAPKSDLLTFPFMLAVVPGILSAFYDFI